MKQRTTKPSSPAGIAAVPRPRVYLDTTVPSYYFDERPKLVTLIHITRDWWDNESKAYDVWISPATLEEIEAGEHPNKDKILRLVRPFNVLAEIPEIAKIAEHYIHEKLMPAQVGGDATHLANGNKRRHLEVINGRLKLPVPQILTPLELFKEIT